MARDILHVIFANMTFDEFLHLNKELKDAERYLSLARDIQEQTERGFKVAEAEVQKAEAEVQTISKTMKDLEAKMASHNISNEPGEQRDNLTFETKTWKGKRVSLAPRRELEQFHSTLQSYKKKPFLAKGVTQQKQKYMFGQLIWITTSYSGQYYKGLKKNL